MFVLELSTANRAFESRFFAALDAYVILQRAPPQIGLPALKTDPVLLGVS